MKYMLLIYMTEDAMSQSEREQCYAKSAGLAQQLYADGKLLATAPLQPGSMTRSVQMRAGNRLLTDGPFVETREQLGGFFLIDAKDLDDAINVAAQIPGAQVGTIEIRPVIELPGLPKR
ncbi:MAG: YciI family protein [Acidobacteria bacterium]|nr:YciI family protein [Acidobacteriota bacterium]